MTHSNRDLVLDPLREDGGGDELAPAFVAIDALIAEIRRVSPFTANLLAESSRRRVH
jgi:hypothetical protein